MNLGSFVPPGAPSRPVRAYVPAGDPGPRPLLVLFDGQNVFGDEGSFAGGWHADRAVDRLGDRTFHAPIVVGVGNGGRYRVEEMGRHLESFLDALVVQVLPKVERRFALTGRRVVGGSSLGGLAALAAWMLHPTVFSGALVMSPSLWFARRALLRQIRSGACAIPREGRIYLDAGAKERGRMLADAAELAAHLAACGLGERLKWRPDARGGHSEKHWGRRLPLALRFLFRR